MHDQFIYKQHVYPASVVCFMWRLLCFLAAFCLFVFVVDVVFCQQSLVGSSIDFVLLSNSTIKLQTKLSHGLCRPVTVAPTSHSHNNYD